MNDIASTVAASASSSSADFHGEMILPEGGPEEDLTFARKLAALRTDMRLDARRSRIHAYIQLHPHETATPIWILRAINRTGRCQMHILEHWLCVWMAPQVGLFGNTTMAQWNQSPLLLPEDSIVWVEGEGAAEGAAAPSNSPARISLQKSHMQKLITGLWAVALAHERSTASSSQSPHTPYTPHAPSVQSVPGAYGAPAPSPAPSPAPLPAPLPSYVKTSWEQFRGVLPNPTAADGDVPQLVLEQVHVRRGDAFLYDCWHAINPLRSSHDRTNHRAACVNKLPLHECMSDLCVVRIHPNEFSVEDRTEYVERVRVSLQIPDHWTDWEKKLYGEGEGERLVAHQTPTDANASVETDRAHSPQRGEFEGLQAPQVLHVSLPAELFETYPLVCPCSDLTTWIVRYCCSDAIHSAIRSFVDAAIGGMARQQQAKSLSILVIPMDIGDERLAEDAHNAATDRSRIRCFLPHQPPQDIVIPFAIENEPRYDYSSYGPLPIPGANQLMQSFRVLSVENEAKLVRQCYASQSGRSGMGAAGSTKKKTRNAAAPRKRAPSVKKAQKATPTSVTSGRGGGDDTGGSFFADYDDSMF